MSKALLVVDVQNDFMPGGALAVPEGDQIVPVVNELMEKFPLVVASQDWHPKDHVSFASNHPGKKVLDVIQVRYEQLDDPLEQVLWPDHCIKNSPGAEFHPDLKQERIHHIIRKGTDPQIDSYSAFHDNGRLKSTGLSEYLREKGVDEVYVVGLALDFCVRATAIDALREGFKTSLVLDATRAVNANEGDDQIALDELRTAGVLVYESTVL